MPPPPRVGYVIIEGGMLALLAGLALFLPTDHLGVAFGVAMGVFMMYALIEGMRQ